MIYTIYKITTGEILRVLSCTAEDLLLQLSTDESYIDGNFPDDKFYIDGGLAISLPAKNETNHVFDYSTKQWVDNRTLEEVKLLKNKEINTARTAANQSFFVFDGKQIAVDALSRSDIDGVSDIVTLTGSLPINWVGAWKAIDNTFVPIPDVATWTAFCSALVAQGTANFSHSQDLKTALAAATTIAEVEAIVW